MTQTAPRIFTPDYYARMSALESGAWWNAAMRDTAARLLATVSLPDAGMALDVGCGSGQTMAWLRTLLPHWRFAGLDVAIEGLHAAHAANEHVMRASALALPFPAATADLVVTLDVVQHLPLPNGDLDALREMRRVLRPGGVLLLRTNAQGFPRTDDDPDAQFRKYGEDALRGKLRAAGFTPLRLSRINALLGLAEIPRELRARRRGGSAGYHGLLAPPRPPSRADAMKRWWLQLEGRAVASGVRLPGGRTILALCVARDDR